jgi:hypothetical protein
MNHIQGHAMHQHAGDTKNLQLAATAISLDVPLDKNRPYTSVIGDGFGDKRMVWHFSGASPDGNTIKAVTNAWNDAKYLLANPNSEVSKCKEAFNYLVEMSEVAKGKASFLQVNRELDTIYTASTAAAAALRALGHPCYGYTKHSASYFWHFNRAAASDLALWGDKDLHVKLPDMMLSYIKCALLNWKTLVQISFEQAEYYAVKHGQRTAFVNKNDNEKIQLELERLLYRK